MKKAVIISVTILCTTVMLSAQELEINGVLSSQHAIGLYSGDIQETRENLNLELEYWGDKGALHVSPYLYVDPLTKTDDTPEWGVREAYIDLFGEFLDIRIGKQAIFWGQAEGAFITDIVSPQNMSSFILADFEEIRIGVPAVKAAGYIGPVTLEAVWIQKFVPSILPGNDSIWRTGLMPDLSGATLPEASLENSEVFARAGYFGSMMTLEIVGGWAWNDLPVAEGSPMSPDLNYYRSLMAGAILSTAVGPVGIRAEGALTFDKPYSSLQTGMPPVLITEDHHFIQGLIGIDGSLLNFNLSAQYILQYISEYNTALVNQKEFVHTATMRIQRTFLDERLTATLFGYVGFEPLDSLIRPEISYWIEDGLEASLGADVFIGESDGRFGIYEDNTEITASVSWYF